MSQDSVEEIVTVEEVTSVLYAVLTSVGRPVVVSPGDFPNGDGVIAVDPQDDGTAVVSIAKGYGND